MVEKVKGIVQENPVTLERCCLFALEDLFSRSKIVVVVQLLSSVTKSCPTICDTI